MQVDGLFLGWGVCLHPFGKEKVKNRARATLASLRTVLLPGEHVCFLYDIHGLALGLHVDVCVDLERGVWALVAGEVHHHRRVHALGGSKT